MTKLENGKIIVKSLMELRIIVEKKEIPLELIDIKESGLNSLDNVFYNIHEINGSIDNWDISNIKYLNSTFSYSKLKNIDIGSIDYFISQYSKFYLKLNYYFNDKYQWIPIGGYNKLIDGLLKNIEVRVDTDYFSDKKNLSGFRF